MDQQKIMIVEDEVIVGIDLKKKVKSLGYAVHSEVIRYGERVLDAAEKVEPDLILMDIRLKGNMDGTEAALQVKKKLALPVVFLTAYSDQTTLNQAKAADPYAYVKKPVRLDDLRITIEFSIYRAKMQQQLMKSELALEQKVMELKDALEQIKTLKGLIPICSVCKKIRDDKGCWNVLEEYLTAHSDAEFSHGMCPTCMDAYYGDEDWYIEMKEEENQK